jgi:enamine deaminase RidA (YjgF/YER057c/UK114 family)
VTAFASPDGSLVRVAGLFRPDVLIEIEAVAALRRRIGRP